MNQIAQFIPKATREDEYWPMKPLNERLDDKIMPDPNSGCWLWTGVLMDGYGAIRRGPRGGGMLRAHRVIWEACHGSIPSGLHVLHKCDVRHCVNPDHLFLGTNLDNIADKMAKGRQAKGESAANVKLTNSQVREILLFDPATSNVKIAEKYGVSDVTISRIRRGLRWKCISNDTP